MQCKDVMLTLVFRCSEDTTVADCAQLMRDEHLGFVPVLDKKNSVVGVVTDRDLALRVVAEKRDLSTPVGAIMSPGPFLTCLPDDDLRQLEEQMAASKKGRALVKAKDGALVGVISLSDIAQRERSASRTGKLLKEVTRRESVSLTHV